MTEMNADHLQELDSFLLTRGTPVSAAIVRLPGQPDMIRRIRLRGGVYVTVRCWAETAEAQERYNVEILAVNVDAGGSAMFELTGVAYDDLTDQLERVIEKSAVVEQTVPIFTSLRVDV